MNIGSSDDAFPSTSAQSKSQLCHMELIAPGPENPDMDPLRPLLLAFFCNSPAQMDQSSLDPFARTSIVRWELSSNKAGLHPNFSQLASKKPNGTGSNAIQVLPRITC